MTRTLDAATYWHLRALVTDALRAHDAFILAQKRQMALFAELGLDPAVNFTLNDETLSVASPDVTDTPK